MERLIDVIKEKADAYHGEVVQLRRHLHANPELSFEEVNTAKYITQFLKDHNIPFQADLGGGTGIIAHVGSGDKTVALRADIDALPIQEMNNVPYKSKIKGVMHACGHDVHTASLMGAIHILNELKDQLRHQVRCIFQPGEEKLPGGASLMIKDGAIDGVRHILGQHVHPDLPSGKFGVCAGYFMASADELFFTVSGRGGHAARPQDLTDTVLASAEFILSLQSIVSRNADPMVASVLSIGKVTTEGGATNIIPDRVHLQGTFRTFDESWRKKVHDLIWEKALSIGRAHGVDIDVNIKVGYPALHNDEDLTSEVERLMKTFVGPENVIQLSPRMTAEDFSYYSHRIPACFYRLGTGFPPEEKRSAAVHTPDFDIDEDALKHSIGMMAWLAMNG